MAIWAAIAWRIFISWLAGALMIIPLLGAELLGEILVLGPAPGILIFAAWLWFRPLTFLAPAAADPEQERRLLTLCRTHGYGGVSPRLLDGRGQRVAHGRLSGPVALVWQVSDYLADHLTDDELAALLAFEQARYGGPAGRLVHGYLAGWGLTTLLQVAQFERLMLIGLPAPILWYGLPLVFAVTFWAGVLPQAERLQVRALTATDLDPSVLGRALFKPAYLNLPGPAGNPRAILAVRSQMEQLAEQTGQSLSWAIRVEEQVAAGLENQVPVPRPGLTRAGIPWQRWVLQLRRLLQKSR